MKHDRSSRFQEPFNFRPRVSINRRGPWAPTAVISLLFAMVLSCCVTVLAGEFSLGKPVLFEGAFDGSAAVDVGNGFFVGATDENNVLRLYSTTDGAKVKELLSLNFGFPLSKKGKIREYDLEGAARIGDLIYWIGSHGRNNGGEVCEERQVLFATKLSGSGENTTLALVDGGPYRNLLSNFKTDAVLAELKLGDAIGEKKPDLAKAPKEPGAINIESLCADHERLLIGFRNPQIGGKALVIPLLNPEAVARGTGPAKFDKAILLDLGGLGIRDMAHWGYGFLIIAGDIKDRFDAAAKPSRLYRWKGGEQDKPADLNIDFSDLNPEAIVIMGQGDKARILILSDDGKYPGRSDKNVFRGVWLQANAPIGGANGN
jgi:Protein of unknown function (DUF3616)